VLSAVATRLTYNFTPSEPRGLYFLAPGMPRRGDLVAFAVPPSLVQLVRSRNYLPSSFTLLKTLVGLPGDLVCIDDVSYAVNQRVLSRVAHSDAKGLPLDPVHFCSVVPAGRAFVASPARTSLDSRYAGSLPFSSLKRAYPLWTY
jgi:conjugative transfer signal peptidase TraF